MIPAYRHSVSSIMPLDLDEDRNHHLYSPNHRQFSSSFSSLSYPILSNPPNQDQDQLGYHSSWEPKQYLPSDEDQTGKTIPSSGLWDDSAADNHESCIRSKLTVWKKGSSDIGGNLEEAEDDGSVKWILSSKMRMVRKMMVSDQSDSYIASNSMQQKTEDQKQSLSPDLRTDNSSSNNYSNHSNNTTVRVCSDCHTTKTPLWRSGPRGPKTLCNACGIRQRKARRAVAAAAASANGTNLVAAETSVRGNKFQNKEKKSKLERAPLMKKKRKLVAKPFQSRKKFSFEDFTLSNNVALKQVFPQEEKEAAILLMALSYGLVHG